MDRDNTSHALLNFRFDVFKPELLQFPSLFWLRTETRDWQQQHLQGRNSLPIRQKRCIIVAEEEDLDL